MPPNTGNTEMDGCRSSISPEVGGPSCFRCVILRETLLNNRLSLPKKFVDKHGENLNAFATFNVVADGPNGNVWKLGLLTSTEGTKVGEVEEEIRRQIKLGNGLDKFIKHYSVSSDDELFFIYKGEAEFDVRIIEKETGCEKSYKMKKSPSPIKTQISGLKEQEPKKRKYSSSMLKPKGPKKIKDEEGGESHTPVRYIQPAWRARAEEKENDELAKLLREFQNIYISRRFLDNIKDDDKCKVIDFTRKLKPEHPSFLNIMRRRHNLPTMVIAAEFAKIYLDGVQEVRFEVPNEDGKDWSIVILRNGRGVCFYQGWSTFAGEHGLVEGDIMIFELISGKDDASIVFKVFINHLVV